MKKRQTALEKLRREFIADCAMKYFRSGELLEWLSERNYKEAASAIRAVDPNDPEVGRKVCEVFGIKTEETPRESLFEATTTISNLTGLHALTASKFAQKASSFKAEIHIRANGKSGDAKSALSLMSMGIIYGTEVTVAAEGEDAEQAVKELKAMIDAGFGEECYD